MNEFQLIKKIEKIVGKSPPEVLVGIGDDAAVLKMRTGKWVVTTDSQIEGVHFSWDFIRPEELGHRLLAVNLSDIASMGAIPRFALVSVALPKSQRQKLPALYKGLVRQAQKMGVHIIGGNLSESKSQAFFDLTLMGELKGQELLRSRARGGDLLAVTGHLGESAAGLAALSRWKKVARRKFPVLVKAHLVPKAEVEFGVALGGLATSCIDVSDGLSSECHHLAEQSGVRIVLQEGSIFLSAALKNCGQMLDKNPLDWALHGGEGYQLLFTFKPRALKTILRKAQSLGVKVTVIGSVEKSSRPEVLWKDPNGKVVSLKSHGWKHF